MFAYGAAITAGLVALAFVQPPPTRRGSPPPRRRKKAYMHYPYSDAVCKQPKTGFLYTFSLYYIPTKMTDSLTHENNKSLSENEGLLHRKKRES